MYGYHCSLCNKEHNLNSNIGKEHYSHYLLERDKLDKLADENRKPGLSKEEADKILYKSIFG
jgi:CRISPR/Cas system-associated exonuclease Cas4 (RecB family)